MKNRIAVLPVLALLSFTGLPLFTATASNGPAPLAAQCVTTVVPVAAPVVVVDTTAWSCTMTAQQAGGGMVPKHGWNPTIWAITNPSLVSKDVKLSILDNGYIGNYYALWFTLDGSLASGWDRDGFTPRVNTDTHLIAPTFNPLWDGTGTTHSFKTFSVTVPAGTTVYIRIVDQMFNSMGKALDGACAVTTSRLLTKGCVVTGVSVSPNWSPSQFTVSFIKVP